MQEEEGIDGARKLLEMPLEQREHQRTHSSKKEDVMELVFGLVVGVVIFIAASFFGGLLYLGAVWLNARKERQGPWGRYAEWVHRKAAQIENKNKGDE